MKLEVWRYDVVKAYNTLMFGKSFNESHILGNGGTHQQETFYQIDKWGTPQPWCPDDPRDTFYCKMKKDNFSYLLPERFLKEIPFMIKTEGGALKSMPVRLKQSDTNVWRFIQGVESLYVPDVKTIEYRTFVDFWNPVEHTHPKTHTILKLIAFSHTQGLKMGVCGTVACGKNSHLTLMKSFIGRTAPKIKTPTKAVFWQTLMYNDRLNIDEITSWPQAKVQEIEEMLVDLADDSPDTDKHSLDASGKMSSTDLTQKGLTFTFNPVSDKNPDPFHSKFKNADKIEDRYPVIYIKGKVTTAIPKSSPAKGEALVAQNLKELQMWSSNLQYFITRIDEEQHGYDRSKNPFQKNSRHLSNTKSLIDHIDAYSKTQEEFDEWMIYLRDARQGYKDMVSSNGKTSKLEEYEEETV